MRVFSTSANGDADDQEPQIQPIWQEAHDQAVAQGKKLYIDPATGYKVITSAAHKKRGKCCGNICRHCPFDYVNVKGDFGKFN
jgi:hypothetical protein